MLLIQLLPFHEFPQQHCVSHGEIRKACSCVSVFSSLVLWEIFAQALWQGTSGIPNYTNRSLQLSKRVYSNCYPLPNSVRNLCLMMNIWWYSSSRKLFTTVLKHLEENNKKSWKAHKKRFLDKYLSISETDDCRSPRHDGRGMVYYLKQVYQGLKMWTRKKKSGEKSQTPWEKRLSDSFSRIF